MRYVITRVACPLIAIMLILNNLPDVRVIYNSKIWPLSFFYAAVIINVLVYIVRMWLRAESKLSDCIWAVATYIFFMLYLQFSVIFVAPDFSQQSGQLAGSFGRLLMSAMPASIHSGVIIEVFCILVVLVDYIDNRPKSAK